MSSKVVTTKLSADGLRYGAKPPGSPFVGTGTTRSCFLCGKHRVRSQMRTRQFLGKSQTVCAPSCKALEEAEAAEAASE